MSPVSPVFHTVNIGFKNVFRVGTSIQYYLFLMIESLFLPVEHKNCNRVGATPTPTPSPLKTFGDFEWYIFDVYTAPLVLYDCLSAKSWHQRDFAPSTHPLK